MTCKTCHARPAQHGDVCEDCFAVAQTRYHGFPSRVRLERRPRTDEEIAMMDKARKAARNDDK